MFNISNPNSQKPNNNLEAYGLELVKVYKNGEISKSKFKETLNFLIELEKKYLENKILQDKVLQDKPKTDFQKKVEEQRQKKNKHQQDKLEKHQKQQSEKRQKLVETKKMEIEARKKKLEKLNYWKEIGNDPKNLLKYQYQFINKISKLKGSERLAALDSLDVIKEFTAEHHYSNKVLLCENFIVKKYCQQDSFGFFMFKNEVKSLKRLLCFPHFPKIIASDPNRLIIYMTYCGDMINQTNLPEDWRDQFEIIKKILGKTGVNSNDMLLRNTCVLDNKIHAIDFGLDTIFGRSLDETTKTFYIKLSELEGKRKLNPKK